MDASAPDEIDWAIVDRFLAGECTPAEAAQVRRWLLAHPGAREFLRRLPGVLESEARDEGADPARATVWNTDAAWTRLASEQAGLAANTSMAAHEDSPRASAPAPVFPIPTAVYGTEPWSAPRGVWAATAAVIVLIGALTLVRGTAERVLGMRAGPVREYVTAAGERATVRLTDGTEITLAPSSRLRVPLGYGRRSRDVVLEGEAVFAVVHDAARPFAVRAGSAIARDVGTRFDVRAYADDRGAVRVAVVEGRVAVTAAGRGGIPAAPASAGDVVTVTDTAVAIVHGADVAALTAWTDGRLVFDAAPVREVLTTIGRWYDLDVNVATPALATRHITATFTNAPVDEVLASVAATLDARVERHGRQVVFVALHASHDK
jgi:transmembrane sensor